MSNTDDNLVENAKKLNEETESISDIINRLSEPLKDVNISKNPDEDENLYNESYPTLELSNLSQQSDTNVSGKIVFNRKSTSKTDEGVIKYFSII
jgi:predicted RND superfamily exporter protein